MKPEGDSQLYNPERKLQTYSLTYGRFIKDNVRIGFSGNYLYSKDNYSTLSSLTKGYGGNLQYQKYFPLINKFYAFANGNTGYQFTNYKNNGSENFERDMHQVSLGANGGLAYFLSKRFLLEANLLSANISYTKYADKTNASKVSNTLFDLSSSGAIDGLGFKIYFLF